MSKNCPTDQASSASAAGVYRGFARHAARVGFTLTELLVVIAIIAMLVAITSVAVVRALGTARQTRMKTEVDQLDTAFKAYKEKYGAYPPCSLQGFGALPEVRQHVARAFPRYNLTQLTADLNVAGIDGVFRPDQALVFWLSGFSSDPLHPFLTTEGYQIINGEIAVDAGNSPLRVPRTPLFDFDTTRLRNVSLVGGMPLENQTKMVPLVGGGMWTIQRGPSYFPQGVTPGTNGAPYVYWDHRFYEASPPTMGPPATPPMVRYRGFNAGITGSPAYFPNAGAVVPYYHDPNENSTVDFDPGGNPLEDWVNPESFQIIASGSDGRFGAPGAPGVGAVYRAYPTGVNYDISSSLADNDNVTNFCGAARLEDEKP